MQQLLPSIGPIDPVEAHATATRPAPPGRPWVLLNMVTSLDGATAVDGVSGGLGGPADKAVFSAIRSIADVILVAAGTARAEGYGPPKTPPARQEDRRRRGQQPFPRLALVTRALDLDPEAPLFAQAHEPPLIYTVEDAPEHRRAALAPVAELVDAGVADVDLHQVLADLHRRGTSTVLGEGGPSLNGQLLAADLVDELNVTLAPLLVGGDAKRLAEGPQVSPPEHLELAHLWHQEHVLLARYVRA